MGLHYPSWMQWYKKPSYVDLKAFAAKLEEKATASSPRTSLDSKRSSRDVPSKLNLERILRNETCSPMSLYDFYMYLKHIEHSPENLEFYVWFKNYENTLPSAVESAPQLPELEKTDDQSLDSSKDSVASIKARKNKFDIGAMEEDDFEAVLDPRIAELINPMCGCSFAPKPEGGRTFNFPTSISNAFRGKDSKTKETCDPDDTDEARLAEVEAIKNLFLVPGAPKELNIPSPMRKSVLAALSNSKSASPDILRPVADHCYLLLKSCSHRNFIRLGVSNGTFETVCMATGLGIVLTVMGFLTMLLLAFCSPHFHGASRWRGIGVWPMWSVGIGLILSGLRGSCFFLLLFSRRQPLPWERLDDDASVTTQKRSRFLKLVSKLMIFDRKMRVKDDHLRMLQRKIVMQSLFGGMVFATIMVTFFLCLPIWNDI